MAMADRQLSLQRKNLEFKADNVAYTFSLSHAGHSNTAAIRISVFEVHKIWPARSNPGGQPGNYEDADQR